MELCEIVENYIKQRDTDFAILINGEWGSGKTYFLKNALKDVIENVGCVVKDEPKNYDLVYVSLYGVTTIDELQKRLFLELNPKLKTKTGIIGTALLSKGLNFVGIEVDKDDQKDLLNIFGGIHKNKVLVFDDLERLETETLNEVLGFINSYTEHQNLKVIIIADEKKIENKLKDYSSIKEKLIRFTYMYNPDLINIFPDFLVRYSSEEYQIFLKDRAEIICTLFHHAAHKNLRTLRFVLDLFEQPFKKVIDNNAIEVKYQNKILDRFLYFFISYTIVYKKGASIKELKSLEDLSYEIDSIQKGLFFNLFNETDILEEEKEYGIEKFKTDFEKVFNDGYDNKFQYFPFLANYIHSGDFPVNELNTAALDMQKRIKDVEDKPEQKALNKLKNCLTLNDEDFLPLIEEIKRYVEEGNYKLEIYCLIFQNLLNCSDNEIEGFKVDKSTVELFKKGMKKSLKNSEYKPGLNPFYLSEIKNELLDELIKYSEVLNESLIFEKEKTLAKQMCKFFVEKRFEELSGFILAEEVHSIPIFQREFINSKKVLHQFLALNNTEKTDIVGFLQTLYSRIDSYRGSLKKESPFFVDLLYLIQGEIKESKGKKTISTLILLQTEKILQNIVDRLDSAI